MNLKQFLTDNKQEIIDLWYKAVIATYPEGSEKFLSQSKSKFSNPIGYTLAQELPVIFDEIISNENNNRLVESLENIIRIRAIQDFKPSEAVCFIFSLKNIINDKLNKIQKNEIFFKDLNELNKNIDNTTGLAFDIFMNLKEKIYEIKANEVKNRFGKMAERIGRKYGMTDGDLI